jgi:hypothetical protein
MIVIKTEQYQHDNNKLNPIERRGQIGNFELLKMEFENGIKR